MSDKKKYIEKLTLTKEGSENLFHDALCNHFGVGGYGLEFDYKKSDYLKAKASLEQKKAEGKFDDTICREDVWMEILRIGGKLKVKDVENDGEYTRSIGLKEVHERVQKTPLRHLVDALNEEDDADTADQIFQTVFFEDIIFG